MDLACATLLFEFLSNGELRLLLFHINRCYGVCKHGEVAIDLSRQGLDVLVARAAAVAVRAVAAVVHGVRPPPDQFRRTFLVHEIVKFADSVGPCKSMVFFYLLTWAIVSPGVHGRPLRALRGPSWGLRGPPGGPRGLRQTKAKNLKT